MKDEKKIFEEEEYDKGKYVDDPDQDPRDISNREIVRKYVEVLEVPNNCFCREQCILCAIWFDADLTIYQLEKFGYICPDCYTKLKLKEKKE